jgi:hypothetical protein
MYQCNDCEKMFSTKGNLKKHMNKENKCGKREDSTKSINNNEIKEIKDMLTKILQEKSNTINNTNCINNINSNNVMKDNDINSHNNINVNSNNSNNLSFNLQYIEKNFTDAKNIEDEVKIEKVTDDIYKECKGKRIKNGSIHLFKKLCIDNKKIEERSIHCLDAARNNYAVKTNDNWQKDNKGTIIKEMCLPVIKTIYTKIMDELYKENELSGGMLGELSIEILKYDNDSFNKTLNECGSSLMLKNCKNNNEIKPKEKDEIKDDIYKQFLNKKTKESTNHIHTQTLYDNFIKWHKENISEKNIPSNRDFMKNLKIHYLVNKSVKVDDKVSTGVKNLELC